MAKSKSRVFLGIDTSCYTSSLALLDENGQTVRVARKMLNVASGQQGLRQSEMVFAHTKNLPVLMAELDFSKVQVLAIGVSKQPRTEEQSYMPAFLAGSGLAQSLAEILQVPLLMLSHQENHMHAGLWSSGMPELEKFLFVHISGGTTEIILIDGGVHTVLSGAVDISAGQFIDRIGVKLGLEFPAGAALEKLAWLSTEKIELPVAVCKGNISFSGPCSAAMRILDADQLEAADMAAAVQVCVANSLLKSISYFAEEYGLKNVLIVGGVACNNHIKNCLHAGLNKLRIHAYFAQPEYSADNALGCAVFARNAYNAGKNLLNKRT